MTKEVDVQSLQEWLSQNRPVTVLDIRPARDREQWWIPGSLHTDAYESLKAGVPGPLLDVTLPEGRPVVTVCGSGRVSLDAASALWERRGIAAMSLRGGMKAWSLAWNTATQSIGPVDVIQIRRTGKGCLSYLICCEAEAAVIDPSIEPEVYRSLAASRGSGIRYVMETHIHADHLSRARALAGIAGAELVLPRQERIRYPHRSVGDGERLRLGTTSIEILSTPGHTDESVTYSVPDVGIFTGDTIFLAGVGRPDLHADHQQAEVRARMLFQSLVRLTSLAPGLFLFPGHTSEPVPFDSRPLTASLHEVSERMGDWLASEDEFVRRILPRIPPAPPNYLVISDLNERGDWPQSDPTDLEAGANRCAVR